jgi:hypothetical protein
MYGDPCVTVTWPYISSCAYSSKPAARARGADRSVRTSGPATRQRMPPPSSDTHEPRSFSRTTTRSRADHRARPRSSQRTPKRAGALGCPAAGPCKYICRSAGDGAAISLPRVSPTARSSSLSCSRWRTTERRPATCLLSRGRYK